MDYYTKASGYEKTRRVSLKTKLIVLGTAVAVLLVVFATGMYSPLRWRMYIGTWEEMTPIVFYGKVLDLSGRPISGAEVYVEIADINTAFILGSEPILNIHRLTVITDQNGKFMISRHRGQDVVVRTIVKRKYKFKPEVNSSGGYETGFYYSGPGANPPYKPDPNNPVIFRMEPAI